MLWRRNEKRGAGVSVAVVVHLRLWGGPITGFINEPICRTYLPDILCVVYKHEPILRFICGKGGRRNDEISLTLRGDGFTRVGDIP